jgi:hypothetical protein
VTNCDTQQCYIGGFTISSKTHQVVSAGTTMSIGSQLFTILICLHVSTYHGHLQVQSVHVITNYLLLGFVLLVHLWNIGGYGFITILDAFLFFSLVFISVHGHSTDVSSL